MNLRQLFDLSLVNRRDEVGLEWAGAGYTFGDIDARSNCIANAFRQGGLARGRQSRRLSRKLHRADRYCIWPASSWDVIFVPINILYREREMSHILRDAEPKRFIAASDLPALAAESARQSDRLEAVPLEGDAPAALVYTSGTTGTSKGAILTHNNFAANAMNLTGCWQITDRDRFLLALPLFHVHALGNGLHCWLVSGCRMRLLERFDQRTAAATFLDFHPTLFFGVPTMYVRLLETPFDTAREIGKRMRLFVSGSAPLPAQVLEEFREHFGHTILERYGMTETMMNISNPYAGERRPGSVGFPLPGDFGPYRRDGRAAPQRAQRFRRLLEARRRDPRSIHRRLVQDRRHRDTLRRRLLHSVRPPQRPDHLRRIQHLSARDRGVPGGAARDRGSGRGGRTRPRARRDSSGLYRSAGSVCDHSSLEARCREKLASFKVPRRFEVVEKLPRNALGKVQKHLLCRAS